MSVFMFTLGFYFSCVVEYFVVQCFAYRAQKGFVLSLILLVNSSAYLFLEKNLFMGVKALCQFFKEGGYLLALMQGSMHACTHL